jgi:hypothetical protein
MTAPLPHLRTVAEVAEALGESQHFVKEKCRLKEWPHWRGSRGRVGFTDQHFAEIVELCSVEASAEPSTRFAFAPRSNRRAS